jgi:MFS family permease
MQDILAFSPLRTGLYYLPFAGTIMVVATTVSRVIGRTGPLLLIMIGTVSAASGMFLMTQATQHTTYFPQVLVSMVLIAGGMGSCFVPLTLTAVSRVSPHEGGIASALLNSGQQVGGSLGLAILGTVAAGLTRTHLQSIGGRLAHIPPGAGPTLLGRLPPPVHHAINHAFLVGYTAAFTVSGCVLLGAFLIAVVSIRVAVGRPASAVTPV